MPQLTNDYSYMPIFDILSMQLMLLVLAPAFFCVILHVTRVAIQGVIDGYAGNQCGCRCLEVN